MSVLLSLFHPQCALQKNTQKLSLMDNFSYVIIIFIFTLLSSVSSSSFSRRHLLQADPSTLSPPFFPLYNSSSSSPAPPQPLSPPVPATFPANISALVLPRSPTQHTPSRTLLIPAISAVLAVATLIGLGLFLYSRWRVQTRSHVKESSVSSDISQSEKQTENKLSVAPSTSEILYLGNVVTSGDSRFVKPESPDISPLPPLPSRSLPNLDQEEEEEDEDFYSPLTSIAGQESRDLKINPYSNCSCSISSDSPATSPNQNPRSPSPKRTVRKSNKRYGGTSLRMFSGWNQNLGFPRISSASTSPERGNIRTPDGYARSSMYSSVSTTPERFFRKVLDSSPPRWNDLRQNVKSLFLSSTSASPARDFCINVFEKKPELDTTEQSKSAACTVTTVPPPQRPPPPMPEPPPLVPPSQSFMVQKSGKKLSFSELPQGSWEVKTDRSKPKLKPLPWDKVRASSRRTATWDRLPYN